MNKPLLVQKHALLFCKWSTAIVLWLTVILSIEKITPISLFFSGHGEVALIWLSKFLLLYPLLIFTSTIVFGFKNSFAILFYQNTIGKIFKSTEVMVDENAMKFVHKIAFVMALMCIMLWLVHPIAGMIMTIIFAGLKTMTAFGYCPADKLYKCSQNGFSCIRQN